MTKAFGEHPVPVPLFSLQFHMDSPAIKPRPQWWLWHGLHFIRVTKLRSC